MHATASALTRKEEKWKQIALGAPGRLAPPGSALLAYYWLRRAGGRAGRGATTTAKGAWCFETGYFHPVAPHDARRRLAVAASKWLQPCCMHRCLAWLTTMSEPERERLFWEAKCIETQPASLPTEEVHEKPPIIPYTKALHNLSTHPHHAMRW
jgi:hypothetical protein